MHKPKTKHFFLYIFIWKKKFHFAVGKTYNFSYEAKKIITYYKIMFKSNIYIYFLLTFYLILICFHKFKRFPTKIIYYKQLFYLKKKKK